MSNAFAKILGAVYEAGGGPWEGRIDLTMEALIKQMGEQDKRMDELMGLIAGKQGELVWLAEEEEEEETPLRSRGTATAAANPQKAGQQEAA